MQDIYPIYQNQIGFAFQWKRNNLKDLKKIQIIFRDIGLLLTMEELRLFSRNIKRTFEHNSHCNECPQNQSCRTLLVDAPSPQITFALYPKELNALDDLVQGTLFNLNLNDYFQILDTS